MQSDANDLTAALVLSACTEHVFVLGLRSDSLEVNCKHIDKLCFDEVKCKEVKLLTPSKRFPKPEPHMRANNSPSGGYNRGSLESITFRKANCLCAARTLFGQGGKSSIMFRAG